VGSFQFAPEHDFVAVAAPGKTPPTPEAVFAFEH
jgi:hypothetical protein